MAKNVESRTITVYPDEWAEFGKICNANGFDRSKLIRIWIAKWVKMAKKGVKITVNV